jgi:hypothetical protein
VQFPLTTLIRLYEFLKNSRGNRLSTTALSIALSQSITKQPDTSSSRFVIETLFNQLYSIIGGG